MKVKAKTEKRCEKYGLIRYSCAHCLGIPMQWDMKVDPVVE